MTCAVEAVGELGGLCRRVRALKPWWRPEQTDAIPAWLEEATQLVRRQAEAREALRAAEDARAHLTPDGTRATHSPWWHEQGAVTKWRNEVVALQAMEAALRSALEVEMWWALKAKWAQGVAALNAMQAEASDR